MGKQGSETELKYLNDIIKSPKDERFYRALILSNQLQALLISDPKTDKSAVSLSVAVGHLSDPDNLPGLAHFCEHMLFMGSEKYPIENEYNKFLSEHGGSSNAFTEADQTLYYFDVSTEHLAGALDRFTQFFLRPLMTKNAVEREVNAVESEHEIFKANDTYRFEQLQKAVSKKGHPYSKFNTGNKMSLFTLPQEKGIDVREELLKFHKKWYSANIMTLVVLGKESLEELEEIVVPLFSQVENKDVARTKWTDHPYGPDQVGTKITAIPVGDLKLLQILFPIPELREYYKAKPWEYINHLVGDEGPGSLLSALKRRNWANRLCAWNCKPAKGFDFFRIYVELTDEGTEKIDEIVTLIFQYLNVLRKCGTQEWIFKERQKISEIQFFYEDKEESGYYPIILAMNLHENECPMEEIISSRYLITDWRPDVIDKLLSDYLIPSNVNVTVVGQKYKDIADETEKWYGTKYKLEKIPEKVIQKWEKCGLNDELRLPSPNEFIPSNLDILFKGDKNDQPRHPLIIHENDFMRMWLKQDDEFLLPKAELKFEFINPLVYFDPFNYCLAKIFVRLLEEALQEYSYSATLTGLHYYFMITEYGLLLYVGGYNDKQHVLIDKIFRKMVDLKIDPQRFEALKDTYIRDLKNFQVNEPFSRVQYHLKSLVAEKKYTKEELLKAAEHAKMEDLQEFMPRFFSKFYVECLLQGNIDEDQARVFIQILEDVVVSKAKRPLLPQELLRYREIELNDGEYFVLEIQEHVHKLSCIQIYLQCCLLSTENNMRMQLLVQILNEPFFDTLRTKEQLSYVAFCEVHKFESYQGLKMIIQSDKHPNFVDHRIEAFLVKVRDMIENMSEEEFERNKNALATNLLEKPKNLYSLSEKVWEEVYSRHYNFNRAEIEVEYLRTVSKNDIIQFFDTYIKKGAPKRRKLSVHIISQVEGGSGTLPEEDSGLPEGSVGKGRNIVDITKFKMDHSLSPFVEPYAYIETFRSKTLK